MCSPSTVLCSPVNAPLSSIRTALYSLLVTYNIDSTQIVGSWRPNECLQQWGFPSKRQSSRGYDGTMCFALTLLGPLLPLSFPRRCCRSSHDSRAPSSEQTALVFGRVWAGSTNVVHLFSLQLLLVYWSTAPHVFQCTATTSYKVHFRQ